MHQLMRVTRRIRGQVNDRKSIGLLSVDLQAAFDTVWHDGLLHKMLMHDFPIHLIKLIRSYLDGWKIFSSEDWEHIFK